ncbi:MAG: flagellar brake protein [Deltaproteobacteria bacterium]|nr:flagellar brake protein [Deltaproteobacteria bacterium]
MEKLEGIVQLDKANNIYIDIGNRVYLEIDGVNFSAICIFIGMLRDEFMIITFPKQYKTIKNQLFSGNKMVVKYLYDGSVYAFKTSVIETITSPIKAIAIEYPKVVQQRELRVVKRNDVVIPGKIEAKNIEFKAVVFDISKKGCRFTYKDKKSNVTALRESALLRVYMQFPGVADEIGVMACIRNVKKEHGKLSIGAEFQDITKPFLTALMHFLYSIEDY